MQKPPLPRGDYWGMASVTILYIIGILLYTQVNDSKGYLGFHIKSWHMEEDDELW